MMKLAIITATRAEYGLLRPIIQRFQLSNEIETRVVVTGAHLSPEFGLTYKEIENEGINIDKKIEILLSSDTSTAISKSMGIALISFGDYFSERRPDAVMVLGDRYEMLAVCIAAMNARIPIIHLYGGETTEGAVDEAIRHSITKMSYLHFTSTEQYRERVIQLGEAPDRVFNVGAIGIENIKKMKLLSKKELEENLDFVLGDKYGLITFHPVTLEDNNSREQTEELIRAIEYFPEMKFIVTKANADTDGRIINQIWDNYAVKNKNVYLVDSLGSLRYLSAMKYSSVVIGNSSSGIIETPSMGVPTVNIGDRQKGRMQAESVINCQPYEKDICNAIKIALEENMQQRCSEVTNPYGNGETSEKICSKVEMFMRKFDKSLKKTFYDIEIDG